ncbi:MAG TPA: pyrroline-5-carboxylate reductase [Candidatus Methanomethylia archaeon]|nr:pyrroline-5-carboxylate reductase [Candidatus Methanomethylicia archaeon]
MVNIGIIGCGRLGTSIAKGWLRGSRHTIHGYDVSPERLTAAEALGIVKHSSLQSLLSQSEVIVVAVKPQSIAEVAEEGAALFQGKLVVSPAALVSLEELQQLFKGAHVVKCMLNIAAEVGESMILYCSSPSCSTHSIDLFEQLFSELGSCIRAAEHLVDLATFIVGCGPACIAYLVEAIAEAGVCIGLPKALSTKLVQQTLKGTAALLQQYSPKEVISKVATPGGVTEQILGRFEEEKLKEILRKSIAETVLTLQQ